MTKKQLEGMTCAEIAALLDEQKTGYARELIIEQLTSARFYDRSVYHAAMNYSKAGGRRNYGTVNEHYETGIINSEKVRLNARGWSAKPKRKSMKRGGRGANKSFSIKGAEIKRIVLKDGPVPSTFTSGVAV